MEEQAAQLDEWRTKLTADAERMTARQKDQEAKETDLVQRAAALEGQQAMLAALRTRLERIREDVRREEEQLAEVRARQEEAEADLTPPRAGGAAASRRAGGRAARREARMPGAWRSGPRCWNRPSPASAKPRKASRPRRPACASVSSSSRPGPPSRPKPAASCAAAPTRSASSKSGWRPSAQALRDRETALVQSEQALAGLQDQLRRRAEEIAARQKAQEEERRGHEETLAAAQTRRAEIEAERTRAEAALATARQELDGRAAELDRLRDELTRREEALAQNQERLKQAGQLVGQERKVLAEERAHLEAEEQQAAQALATARAAFDATGQEVADLQRQLPELEARAGSAAERLALARTQLREHLDELHAYARDARADLEALRTQVQAEAERVRQQEVALHRERDEHRLAVAAFRQQLIDWQAQVADMKRSLARGETRLERRLAEVDEQARQVDATTARLAQQAEQLQQQERIVAERRGEVEQHLEDMREWYRRKLRELTGRTETDDPPSGTPDPAAADGNILTLTGEVERGDQKLGDLLRSLELVDADTLTALLVEARRQRRTLRQLLLAGGYLTLYQMALIEAGNLDGLVLGPFRLIDRLRATPREVVYRVFDPRHGCEAVLRHLAEAEMQDAVHPDEFRQRFAALAALRHPHLLTTLEVLELAGRPAVLQEWLSGLPSGDWPALAAVPGVWYRLLCQTTLGLHTLHQAGLAHGRLDAGSILLTAEGTVKLCGAGEPAWLRVPPSEDEGDVAADLAALGAVAAAWLELAQSARGPRPKPLPASLQAVLARLRGEPGYATAGELLEELERASSDVPANAAAWERLLRHVREEAADTTLRLSA